MKEILKQTSWLVFAQILTKIIGFFYTIFLARNLGVSDFGLYSLGLAYFSIISSFSDFGFNRYLIREISKERRKIWELLCNLIMIRLTLICFIFALFSIFLYIFDADKTRVSIILLSILAVLPQTIALTFDGVFIALRKLQFSAAAAFAASLSTVLIGLYLITNNFGVYGAVNALILGQFIFATVFVVLLYLREGVEISQIKLSAIKKALLGSLPYSLLGILGLLYFKIDTVILSYIRGNFETGIYSAGYKFLEALAFIPNALSFALFPKFVSLHLEKKEKLKQMLFKSIKLMFSLGILVMIAYLLILPIIINIFLPKFSSAITVIRILSFAIPLMFIHVSAASVLLSTDRFLKQVILASFIPLIFNIIFNLIFIPKYGFLAASWVTVLSDVVSVSVIFYCIKKYVLGKR